MEQVWQSIPPNVYKFLLALALAFMLGLEREVKKIRGTHYYFGGITTFPLIALMGFGAAVLSVNSLIPVAVGLAVVGGFLLISYRHKITTAEFSGFTSEISGVVTYLQGALIYFEHYWIATTLVVLTLLILELKKRLETWITKMPSEEIFTFARFLFLTAVILPIVPNHEFTQFKLNPFKIWLIVVAVSSLSYLSYLLQIFLKERGGILVSALVGGTYSSTAVTVTLSKRGKYSMRPHLYSGSIWMACGIMFLRIIILLGLFNPALMREILIPFSVLSASTCLIGFFWSRRLEADMQETPAPPPLKNPLEILTAFLFAFIFIAILVATHLTVKFFGIQGIYYLSGLVGGMDVDPFILGLTQTAGKALPYTAAAGAVVIAASANNFFKALYALIFGGRKTGFEAGIGLIILTLAGLATLFWI